MKVNDIVLDKKQKLGIISKIENHKITVSYDVLETYEYDEVGSKLTVLDEALIDFIHQTVAQMGKTGNNFYDIYNSKITGINYQNKILTIHAYQNGHFQITVDYQNKITKSNTENKRYYTHQIISALSRFLEQINFLKSIKIDEPSNIDDLNKATTELKKHFFDFSLFNQFVSLIQQKGLKELYLYCNKLGQSRLDPDYKSYFLFLVSTSTNYVRQLCFALSNHTQEAFEVFYWTLAQSNYTQNEKYIVYSSIQMMKEKRYEEWVQMTFIKGKEDKLVDGRETINKIFKAIINKTTNIMFYWKVIDCYCMFYEKNYYADLIFTYASLENKIVLLENDCITTIGDHAAVEFDLDAFLKYHHLMTYSAIRRCINKYFKELMDRNPKRIVDILIHPSKGSLSSEDMAILKKVLPHIPDSKYLQTFLNAISFNSHCIKLDHLMNS